MLFFFLIICPFLALKCTFSEKTVVKDGDEEKTTFIEKEGRIKDNSKGWQSFQMSPNMQMYR